MLRRIRTSIAAGLLATACATSPLGRQQILMYPEPQVAQMGAVAFRQLQSELPVASDSAGERYVQCVVDALAGSLQQEDAARTWEVKLFDDPSANAFALPGGKIGVHTGMLKIATTQGELATVLAHEIGHVVAHHTNERLSTTAVAQSGLSAVQALLGGPGGGREQLMAALGLGAQVGILLPFNRAQESEADLLGLSLMARAGFDPQESVALWRRMEAAGGQAPPELLSTHPSDATRIERLRRSMADASRLRAEAARQGRQPRCSRPR